MTPCYIDFEFSGSENPELRLVCCSYAIQGDVTEYWLLNDVESRRKLAHETYDLSLDHCFIAYSVEAEARCLFQLWDEFDLPYKPFMIDGSLKFIDLMLEYRMLLNENHEIQYGKQLIDGKIKTTKPPTKDKRAEDDYDKPKFNLGAATYKMLGKIIDTKEKESVRGLIISNSDLTPHKHRVQSYCTSDILHLPELSRSINGYLAKKIGFNPTTDHKSRQQLINEQYLRGEYAARAAMITMHGLPYARQKLKRFTRLVPELMKTAQEDLIAKYPDMKLFKWVKKNQRYSVNVKSILKWIGEEGIKKVPNWPLTDKGDFKRGMKEFEKLEHHKGFGGDWSNYLWDQSMLKSFVVTDPHARERWLAKLCDPNVDTPKEPRKTFWDSAGDDNRSRPYLGIYGSQSARTQPSSTGFLPLKSHWMRCFIVPPEGKAIVGIDYANQEFLLAALISKDPAMIKAYHSGDPYVWFAKAAGAMPQDGTKKTHSEIRTRFKSTTLGVLYGMGKYRLADKLTEDTGEKYKEEDAKGLIDLFNATFAVFAAWKEELLKNYKVYKRPVKLPCGWYMWTDNDRPASVQNCPIQGFGSSIMRKAVQLCQDDELDVVYTLHDAIYVEYPSQCIDYTVELLKECMDKAFRYYFPSELQRFANCRMDVFAWSLDYKNYKHDYYHTSHFYLEEKGIPGYNKYKQYLNF